MTQPGSDVYRRLDRLERRDEERDEEMGRVWRAITRLQVRAEDAATRHANAPAWVGIIVSAVTALIVAAIGLYAAGVRP